MHPAKFGGDSHCGSGDIMILVCYVILQDHVIKGLSLYRQAPIKVSYHPANFVGHKHCGGGDIMILVCHVMLQDHLIKGPCDF